MVVSPEAFPPRKRRPATTAFISPAHISSHHLLNSLLALSTSITSLAPLKPLLTQNSTSLLRKVNLLTLLFQDLRSATTNLPSPTLLCLDEMHVLLQRIKALIEDCDNGSQTWLLTQIHTVANTFRELAVDLSTLLDVLPVNQVDLNDDVRDLVRLASKQCYETDATLSKSDEKLRRDAVRILDKIRREIVPDQSEMSSVFTKLGLTDSSTCRAEMEKLEEEFQGQNDDRSKSEIMALIGLIRYGKCVLYGASTPNPPEASSSSSGGHRRSSSTEVNVPTDFRCPISLDLMTDPVVVSTGQTYDRASISLWIKSGHDKCPKTGQTLAHTELIPNLALRSMISLWCREQRIPFQSTDPCSERGVECVGITSKTGQEATRMTVAFLVNGLAAARSMEEVNGLVHELRALAKTDSDSRTCIAEAGGIPLLVRSLGSGNPSLQTNAVTTLLNLSILEANKIRIMETDGALNGVIEVLQSGATWEAKGNAAATIFSLSGVPACRRRLGRKTRVVKGLLDLAREGPIGSKRDAMVAIMNLAGDRETVGKLVELGAVEVVVGVMGALQEEALTVLEMVVKRGGVAAIAAAYSVIRRLGAVLRDGSDQARESAAATLVIVCRKGGLEVVAELAGISGIERVIWALMGTGTVRARRKAASLLRILRRWAAGLDGEAVTNEYSARNLITSTSRMLLSS